jgi:hypothetical protein
MVWVQVCSTEKPLPIISEGTKKTEDEGGKSYVQELQKVNDTYMKTMYAGMMDRGFTVCG